jgi:hypothetical protein
MVNTSDMLISVGTGSLGGGCGSALHARRGRLRFEAGNEGSRERRPSTVCLDCSKNGLNSKLRGSNGCHVNAGGLGDGLSLAGGICIPSVLGCEVITWAIWCG